MVGKVSLFTEHSHLRDPPAWVARLIGEVEVQKFKACRGRRPSWAVANFREGKEIASCYMGLDGRRIRFGGLEGSLIVRPICGTTEGVRTEELRNTRWEDFETGLQSVTPCSIIAPSLLLACTPGLFSAEFHVADFI